jgi:alkanesulfonate monooxygenase SsuD/methylene tetrahydromethanopterin reductase-like flavin-dependent oxidoreductase (luciferase family)
MNAQIPLLLALSAADHDIDRCVATARRAEEAGVDALVLLDDPAEAAEPASAEPATVLARIAAVTERIGLIGTFAAGYHDSLELARRLADLDYISGGRIGWRVETDASRRRYFGSRQTITAVEQEIWDAGVVGSVFERWSLRTELRSAQGVPVILADVGARFAAGFADVVVLDAVREEAEVARARASALKRENSSLRVFPQIHAAADELARWVEWGAADGFLLQPQSPDDFLEQVLPEVRHHFGINLGSTTLRERLGLPGPAPIPTSVPAISLVGTR